MADLDDNSSSGMSLACVMACGTLVWRDARDARDDGTRERRLAVAALSWTSLGLSVASEAAVEMTPSCSLIDQTDSPLPLRRPNRVMSCV